ncbi:MAG: SIS domain-containing protein, partial [Alphaproteobacteria bacterium]
YAAQQGQVTGAIVNVAESTIARESDCLLATHAGAEIGVASTKAFTAQLAVLACLTVATARARGAIGESRESAMVAALAETPARLADGLAQDDSIARVAGRIAAARTILYMGRGTAFPLAVEGALKLKELTYLHAEGYAAGELKHGALALVDSDVPVVVLAPPDPLREKTFSNMEEVIARGGQVILISDKDGIREAGARVSAAIEMPPIDPFTAPLLYALPIQLLAYHAAVALGRDVDQPRNLAKSVTVE